jgi:hypothetical protein
MNTFDCNCADPTTAAPPDPRKHVNYVQGMVLGVDDLIQEFAYHQHQRQWLGRDAIGYGTLSGLRVTFESDLKVHVSPGTALSPNGQLIRVKPEQCAEINKWLAETWEKIKNLGNNFPVYVVLCFRDCKVDDLPVPGEPCRCEDQAMAPSRVLDDFRLELRLDPPVQREEDAIRDFVQWLRQIKLAGAGGSSLDEFLQAIRDAASDLASPLESPPDFLYGSPPQSLAIPSAQLCEYLRAALKLWVVELRPLWQAQWAERVGGGCGCHGDEQKTSADAEECLLLAALNITLTGRHVASANDVAVNDSCRPFVAHLRMLQEMLLCGPCCGSGGCNDRTFATIFALDDHTLRLWIHHPVPVTFDTSAVQLEIDESPAIVVGIAQVAFETNVFDLDLGASPPGALQRGARLEMMFDTHRMMETGSPPRTVADAQALDGWCYPDTRDGLITLRAMAELGSELTSAPQPGGVPVAENVFTNTPPQPGTSQQFARADHTHGTPPDPIPPHDQNANAHRNLTILGDVTGTPANTTVVGLQAVPLPAPTGNGNTLVFRGGSLVWEPKAGATTPTDVVEHPPGVGDYFIVAAGWFTMEGVSIGPAYNKLRGDRIAPGVFRLTFGQGAGSNPAIRYLNPLQSKPPKFVYVVKGTSFGKYPAVFHVSGFENKYFQVELVPTARPYPDAFMIEISLYGKF